MNSNLLPGVFVAALMTVALALPAQAQNACGQPFAPAVPAGATATKDQLLNAQSDVMAFLKASDDYQTCLIMDLARQKDLAKKNGTDFNPNMEATTEVKRKQNQGDKERVGKEFNDAVTAYKAAHPG